MRIPAPWQPSGTNGRRTCRVSAAVLWTGEAEARAAEAQTLEIKVATLSDSLAAEGVRAGTLLAHRSLVSSKPAGGLEQVERERLRRDARDAELKAQHFEARAATLQQVRHAAHVLL